MWDTLKQYMSLNIKAWAALVWPCSVDLSTAQVYFFGLAFQMLSSCLWLGFHSCQWEGKRCYFLKGTHCKLQESPLSMSSESRPYHIAHLAAKWEWECSFYADWLCTQVKLDILGKTRKTGGSSSFCTFMKHFLLCGIPSHLEIFKTLLTMILYDFLLQLHSALLSFALLITESLGKYEGTSQQTHFKNLVIKKNLKYEVY